MQQFRPNSRRIPESPGPLHEFQLKVNRSETYRLGAVTVDEPGYKGHLVNRYDA